MPSLLDLYDRPFHSGEYHAKVDSGYKWGRGKIEKTYQNLTRHYTNSERLIAEMNWDNPLQVDNARALLMGFATRHTADAFTQFVHGRNPKASIVLADFSPYPLDSYNMDSPTNNQVRLVQTDTVELGFAKNSFDLIETDRLLQFLTLEQKKLAISEWFRVLRPGGIITTRDKFVSMNAPASEHAALVEEKNSMFLHFGTEIFISPIAELRRSFRKEGFQTVFRRMPSKPESRGISYQIAARKPE
jgi:hypothetical protein